MVCIEYSQYRAEPISYSKLHSGLSSCLDRLELMTNVQFCIGGGSRQAQSYISGLLVDSTVYYRSHVTWVCHRRTTSVNPRRFDEPSMAGMSSMQDTKKEDTPKYGTHLPAYIRHPLSPHVSCLPSSDTFSNIWQITQKLRWLPARLSAPLPSLLA